MILKSIKRPMTERNQAINHYNDFYNVEDALEGINVLPVADTIAVIVAAISGEVYG